MVAYPPSENSLVKKRMEVVFLLFLTAILILALRLTYLQWIQGRRFSALAASMQGRILQIDARRGRILDRNGNELAADILAKAVIINPRVVADPAATAARLAELLKLDDREREAMRARIERGAQKRSAYCKLRRGVERRLALRILELSRSEPALKAIWLEDSPQRVNPSGSDGIQLLGQVNIDGEGIEAIELRLDPVLRGRNGERAVRVSATGQPVPESGGAVTEPVDGRDVRLTLDRDIQHFAEVELARMAREQSPDAATAVVMDVATGDVLAMTNWPTYRPGQAKVTPAMRRNRAVTDLYEPGSIFKVITGAAALEAGCRTSAACGGSWTIGKRTVRCAHGASHGAVDLRKMIEKSCNIAAGQLAQRVGPKRFHEFLTGFGFQSKTGIEFPGEEYGTLQDPKKWAPMRTANIGFGQGIVCTPIQMVAAYAAIANDGVYNPPRLVLDAPGLVGPPRQARRVISAANAAALRSHMEAVVVSGTGNAAKIARYSAAGKTGTAQIARNGRYGHGYVASFVGFVPATRPRLAILVSVWHPKRGHYGGVVAAPVFREISRHCAAYLRIPPDVPHDLRDGSDRSTFYRHARAAGAAAAAD